MNASGVCVVVPVKGLDDAKSRLSEVLSPEERAALVVAMLEDVLAAVREVHAGPVAVVTPESRLSEVASTFGAELLRDAGTGYNAAIEHAVDVATSSGWNAVLVVPADQARVRADELREALSALASSEVVVAPSDDGGTGLLGLRPPDAIGPAFGPGSGAAHARAAREAGRALVELQLRSLAVDVDTLEDLNAPSEPPLGPRTTAFVEGSDALGRLRRRA